MPPAALPGNTAGAFYQGGQAIEEAWHERGKVSSATGPVLTRMPRFGWRTAERHLDRAERSPGRPECNRTDSPAIPPGDHAPARGSRDLWAEKPPRCPLPYRLRGKSMPASRYRAALFRVVRTPVTLTFNLRRYLATGLKIPGTWRESGDGLVVTRSRKGVV